MRVIARINCQPPNEDQATRETMFANALKRMVTWLEGEYPGWGFGVDYVVGFEDGESEARSLLQQEWVARE